MQLEILLYHTPTNFTSFFGLMENFISGAVVWRWSFSIMCHLQSADVQKANAWVRVLQLGFAQKHVFGAWVAKYVIGLGFECFINKTTLTNWRGEWRERGRRRDWSQALGGWCSEKRLKELKMSTVANWWIAGRHFTWLNVKERNGPYLGASFKPDFSHITSFRCWDYAPSHVNW